MYGNWVWASYDSGRTGRCAAGGFFDERDGACAFTLR